jgi:hypothetical protein
VSTLLADLLSKARAAVDHHRSGYDLAAGEYDANTMVTLMDELGVAVDACNIYPADLASVTIPDGPQRVSVAPPAEARRPEVAA